MNTDQSTADRSQTAESRKISFEKYGGEELLGTIARLVILPRYAARLLLLPVLLAAIPVLGGGLYLLIQERTWDALWFLVIGMFLALTNGFLVGAIYLLRLTADDLRRLTALSSRVSLQILEDIRGRTGDDSTAPRLAEIARGSIIMVILPGVLRTIKGRLPLLGGLISILAAGTLKRFAGTAALRLDKGEEEPEAAVPGSGPQTGMDRYLATGGQRLDSILSSAGAAVESGLRKASFPFKLLLAITLPLSILVLAKLILHGA